MNANGMSIQRFIDTFKDQFTADQMNGFLWLVARYKVAYVYTVMNIVKNPVSPDRMLKKSKAYKPRNYETAKRLFDTDTLLVRNTDFSRTLTTLHCKYNGRDVIESINEWDDLKQYVHNNNLIIDVYDGCKYAFMSKEAESLVVIYKKVGDKPYIEDELVRYIDLDRHNIERYIYKPEMINVTKKTQIGGNTFITLPLITRDISSKYNIPNADIGILQ